MILIGSGGSGKSTLAKLLGNKLNIKVHHLDALFWKPNWEGVPKEEQRTVQNELVKEDEWIIDGNYGGTMDIRMNAADTIIFLDIHRTICVYRAFKRVVQYRNKTRPDMGAGCEERFDLQFFKWIWDYPNVKRPTIIKELEKLPEEKKVIVLKSSSEVQKFLERIIACDTTILCGY
ncbi:DNA topology modulation protein [Bacillus tropicus]|uniref:DNA topology modulation protein n=2 Tax=Bacillus TaxID=1386 RepID=UPI001D0EEEFE|nr:MULTISPECIES: DNA topology modulation protein [Bacillus cereus group]MCC2340769.1 DNA topology modulation protein [Bacillus tropicus]MCU5425356.1 DNA topology modulation protein [Bacillus tropicus]MDA1805572.1 DNA topology modulation protein [Bacillus cereus group sp. BY32LC]